MSGELSPASVYVGLLPVVEAFVVVAVPWRVGSGFPPTSRRPSILTGLGSGSADKNGFWRRPEALRPLTPVTPVLTPVNPSASSPLIFLLLVAANLENTCGGSCLTSTLLYK